MSISEAALQYGLLGWLVLPLYAKAKRPRIDRWHFNASSDDAVIERWFTQYPDSNVGLLLGPKSDVVDIECDNAEGRATASELLADCQTPTWDSVRGTHRLFRYPVNLPTDLAVTKARGLEIRLGSNGKGAQSVLPPSIHPSGKLLQWRPNLSPFDVELAEFPESVRQLLVSNPQVANQDDGLILTFEDNDLATAVGAAEGNRHVKLMRLAGTYLSQHGYTDQLLPLSHAWAQRCTPPMPPERVDKEVGDLIAADNRKRPQQPQAVQWAMRSPKLIAYQPFPVDALPDALRIFIRSAAASVSCDIAFIALPVLGTVAAAIGNSVRFRIKADWTEPSLLWTGIVGQPGDRKTPAIACATEPLLEMQRQLQVVYEAGQYERDKQRLLHEVQLKSWKARAVKDATPEPPPLLVETESEPRLWCDDTTTEALGVLLAHNPRGLLLKKDELTSWLKSFGEYKGKGGDLQRWLSIHSTSTVAIDRKSGDTINLWRPNVSICGGIQPRLLQSFFGGEYVAAGLMQRFLFAWPPVKPAKLTRRGIDANAKMEYAEVLRRLQQIPYGDTPVELSLSEDAWLAFEQWHDFIEYEFKPSIDGLLHEVGSKLVAAAVRLAGIMQCVGDANAMEISADAMRLGILLTRWFLDEFSRVNSLQGEPAEQQANRQLAEFICRKFGGHATASEITRYRRDIASVAEAEAWLQRLQAAGLGAFQTAATAGRPRCEFVVSPDVASTVAP